MRAESTALLMLAACLAGGCGTEPDSGPAMVPADYQQELDRYYSSRLRSLTGEYGWMRLAGLFWLRPGENTFGSDPASDIVFPAGLAAPRAGAFVLDGETVRMTVRPEIDVRIDGEPVVDAVLHERDYSPMAVHGSLSWVVIRRGDLFGVRLYNARNPQADAFTGFARYATDPRFRLQARFVPHEGTTTIRMMNVLGQEEDVDSPGTLEFTIDGRRHALVGLAAGPRLFVIFADPTNRTETYQAGRYLYVELPAIGESLTIVDFNKAYNPPCAFSAFTTCQLPPPQNRLDVPITAGEKRPG
jgi:uncharacterized protein (DUF1684 family)